MANPKKRYEFESSFGNNARSPKRPKLEVIQRPSTSAPRSETSENDDENDDLWGDELENDAVEEVLLLESQACTLQMQAPKSEHNQHVASGVFKPKTAVISSAKCSFVSVRDSDPREAPKTSGSGFIRTLNSDHGAFNPPAPVSHVIQPLVVEKIKSKAIGKGCQRSSSMPTISSPHSSSTSSPNLWSEIKDLTRRMTVTPLLEDKSQPSGVSREAESDEDEICKTLKTEVEKLRSEAYTKAGEAALLRQKIKDAGLELERERQHRAEMLEKSNQKHQQEMAALKRELEAAKTQLQFKELDVDKAVEKCKLLEAGTIKVRPVELKYQSPARPSCTNDFPNRSMFEGNTPRKKVGASVKLKLEDTSLKPENEPVKVKAAEIGIQTEKLFTISEKILPIQFTELSEGVRLSSLIVPQWFEMDSGTAEEQFESKWEGVAAVTELFKLNIFEGKPLERIIEWCWKRMLAFLSILRKKSEDDYRFHKMKKESRKQYEEWCLDRRIPLPAQEQSVNEGLQEDWFRDFAEEALGDEMQCLLSYRPWCPMEVMPEIRRTFALTVALMRVSSNVAPILGSHNERKKNECVKRYTCCRSIENENGVEVDKLNEESVRAKDNQYSTSMGEVPQTSKDTNFEDNQKSVIGSGLPHTSRDTHSMSNKNSVVTSEVRQTLKDNTSTDHQDLTTDGQVSQKAKQSGESDIAVLTGETVKADEIGHKDNYMKIPNDKAEEDVDMDPKNILKFDFVHLVQQICKTVSGMRKIIPMEGTLAGILVFLSSLNQQLMLSRRGLSLVSAVIKKLLFMRPRLRILIHLMRLLVVAGKHPLILQQLCVNSAWNTACRDRLKSLWMFTKGVCPLQILITILENITDERIPDGVSQEVWFKYRAKIGLSFIQWLNVGLSQPGHQVDWLCYALNDEFEDEINRDEHSNMDAEAIPTLRSTAVDENGDMEVGEGSDSVASKRNAKKENVLQEEEKMETEKEEMPRKTLPKLLASKPAEETEEPNQRCCCRRWIMNMIVNVLYAISSDFDALLNPGYKMKLEEIGDKLIMKRTKHNIVNKRLALHQSQCLILGIFVLRELLRRGHPEFNTPGGEGFVWNHYTVKGTILINGKIVMTDCSHKNISGGPIGGRYLLLLSRINRALKDKIVGFCPETEKALQELLEVERAISPVQESTDMGEDAFKMWDIILNIGTDNMKL